jgi:hypothetical protein
MHTGFWWENLKGTDRFEDRSRWENNTETWFKEAGCEGVDWPHLAQDRDKCQSLVNMVMNFGFHKIRNISSLTEQLLASQEELCSMERVRIIPTWILEEINEWTSGEHRRLLIQ